jgi:hypothetical protein
MSEDNNETNTNNEAAAGTNRYMFRMTDDLIIMIRELFQFSILTGGNVVDHLRSIVVEATSDGRNVTIAPEFVQAYNDKIQEMAAHAEAAMAQNKGESNDANLS